ncbi:hypothetical protein E2C01_036397 [Portunus trituberculatus]|uniref:Uncharacterized protein n=1 Tax=Portunus trituberculatus TaxID=210409 RepID=A0A5B7FB90_PORTR|nr:hypothetical protein [Portunus trituberculatus]
MMSKNERDKHDSRPLCSVHSRPPALTPSHGSLALMCSCRAERVVVLRPRRYGPGRDMEVVKGRVVERARQRRGRGAWGEGEEGWGENRARGTLAGRQIVNRARVVLVCCDGMRGKQPRHRHAPYPSTIIPPQTVRRGTRREVIQGGEEQKCKNADR